MRDNLPRPLDRCRVAKVAGAAERRIGVNAQSAWPRSVTEALEDIERVARSGKVETGAALRILWDVGMLQADLDGMREEERESAYEAGFTDGSRLAGRKASMAMGFKEGYWESMAGRGMDDYGR